MEKVASLSKMAAPLMQILRVNKLFSPLQGLKVLYSGTTSKYYSKTTPTSHQKAALAHIQPQKERSFLDDEPKEFLDDDYFKVKQQVSVKNLFGVGAHLGHKTGCRDPYMAPFLFGTRFDIDIIDLEQTKVMMQDALNFAAHIAYRGGVILFVSRYRQTLDIVEQTAKDCGEYAHCRYWRGGSFTNSDVIYKGATRLPDLCIFMSVLNSVFETHAGVIDSAKLLIPSIGIVDTNCDPRLLTYPIPANDDTPVAVKLYCELFKQAILAGKAKREKDEHVN